MYEIWLMLNIAWETALGIWPLLLAVALLWLGLMAAALLASGTRWKAVWKPTLIIGTLTGVAAFLLLPGAVHSSLSDMGYWLDWATLTSLAMAVGGATVAFAWPGLAWFRGRAQA